jgi:hypothetical protein
MLEKGAIEENRQSNRLIQITDKQEAEYLHSS